MSDTTLRSLERACTTPQAEIRLWRERARRGLLDWHGWEWTCETCGGTGVHDHGVRSDLSAAYPGMRVQCACPACHGSERATLEDRLSLAAFAGHEGAQRGVVYGLCGCTEDCTHPDEGGPFAPWISGLSRWPGAPVRAALAAAKVALAEWEALKGTDIGEGMAVALSVAERSVTAGNSAIATRDAARQAFQAPRRALEACEAWIADPTQANALRCENALSADLPGFAWHLLMAVGHAPRGTNAEGAIKCALAEGGTEATVREGIQASLTAWALR